MKVISETCNETANLQTYHIHLATWEVIFMYHFVTNNYAPFHLSQNKILMND